MSFHLTYATMYNPPETMHERFEAALARVEATLGARHRLFIDGADVRVIEQANAGPATGSAAIRSITAAG